MLRRVAAQTLPVQAYYAVFNAGRATTTTRGTVCNTHSALQRDFATQRVKSGYKACGVTLVGDPFDVAAAVLVPP
jgi:hypothetical protein